jgi:hypothetical protein
VPTVEDVHRRLVTAVVTAVVAVLTATLLPVLPASSAYAAAPTQIGAATDVTGDDENDLYRGTGGLVVPESSWTSDHGSRREVAGCLDCEWRITRLCSKDQQASGGCRRIDVGCPVGTVAVRVWLRRVGGEWAVVGRMCQGDEPPRTVTDVGTEVREQAERLLPALRVRVEPNGAALVSLPVVGRTGQPAEGIRGADLSVLGTAVVLDARVRWRWDWADGAAQWYADPGSRWPDTAVSHTYRTPGARSLEVTALWRGEFVVEGLGPFAVPGPPLTQVGTAAVDVREARAVLTR